MTLQANKKEAAAIGYHFDAYKLMVFFNFASFLQGEVYCFSRLEDAVREAEFIFECVTEDIVIKQNICKR